MRIAVFASGGGSNFQAIADACLDESIPAEVVCCIASRPDAGVIERAKHLEIDVHVLSSSPEGIAGEILRVLDQKNVDLIALAGFMKMIPESVVRLYRNRILNIHPALLPDFGGKGMYGMNVHRAVIESGASESGATVHLVDEHYDTGAVVLQESVNVEENDSPEDLAERVLHVEHRLYPRAIALFANDRVRIEGRHVEILERDSPDDN